MAAPQVWALLLEKTHPRLASDVIYVAGDRVVRAAAQVYVQSCTNSIVRMGAAAWK